MRFSLIATAIPLITTNGLHRTKWKCSHYGTATTSLTPMQPIASKNRSQSQSEKIAQCERALILDTNKCLFYTNHEKKKDKILRYFSVFSHLSLYFFFFFFFLLKLKYHFLTVNFYRPHSQGKVKMLFLHVSVCLSVYGEGGVGNPVSIP